MYRVTGFYPKPRRRYYQDGRFDDPGPRRTAKLSLTRDFEDEPSAMRYAKAIVETGPCSMATYEEV